MLLKKLRFDIIIISITFIVNKNSLTIIFSLLRKSRFNIIIILITFIINESSLTIVFSNFIFNLIFEITNFFIINIIKREIKR